MSSSFLQSEAWQRFQETAGNQTVREQGLLYIQKPLPIPRGTYAVSSRCSIQENYTPPQELANCWFLRIEPADKVSLANLKRAATAQKLPLVPTLSIQPRQTVLVDLSKGYEEVIKNMKPKHRYNIKVAEKHGVTVDIISHNIADSFERFWQLLDQTASRHEFRTHNKQYYLTQVKELEKDGAAHLLIAHAGESDLAGMILLTHEKTATYLHGGSTNAHKELMAPYALHAAAIKLSIEKNCHTYDLWGSNLVKNIETGAWEPQAGHSSYGTSRFKAGFGGTVVEYPGTYDLILKPFCYTLYKTVRRLRGGNRAFA